MTDTATEPCTTAAKSTIPKRRHGQRATQTRANYGPVDRWHALQGRSEGTLATKQSIALTIPCFFLPDKPSQLAFPLTRNGGAEKLTAQAASDWPNSFRSSRLTPAVEFIRATRARTVLMREFQKYLTDFDVLVSRTSSPSLTITNLTGQPQMIVPCGFPNDEAMGLLFTGHLFEEGKLAHIAKSFQDATDWHLKRPPASPHDPSHIRRPRTAATS